MCEGGTVHNDKNLETAQVRKDDQLKKLHNGTCVQNIYDQIKKLHKYSAIKIDHATCCYMERLKKLYAGRS